ncbi:hypothetical protein HMPREF9211_1307 [Lactobacillus iners LactinV 01V1-a]|nr:hypothetical protein HMPREF9211_1307 [Lactobacillus iners LactinV 01V1-a]
MEGGFPFTIRQPRFSPETLAAIQEARNIMSGKIKAKSYKTTDEFLQALNAED